MQFEKKMEIKPKKGLDNLLFGQNVNQVINILGKPDHIFEIDDEDDDDRVQFEFYDKKITTRFYGDLPGKLSWIETENKTVEIFGQKVIGMKIEKIINLFKDNGHNSFEREEYQTFTTLFYDKIWIELECTYNRVQRVKCGVNINDNDVYEWIV